MLCPCRLIEWQGYRASVYLVCVNMKKKNIRIITKGKSWKNCRVRRLHISIVYFIKKLVKHIRNGL